MLHPPSRPNERYKIGLQTEVSFFGVWIVSFFGVSVDYSAVTIAEFSSVVVPEVDPLVEALPLVG